MQAVERPLHELTDAPAPLVRLSADAAYDCAMNLVFIGMFLALCGLEVAKRLYLGGSVIWTLHSAGFRTNAPLMVLFVVHWRRAGGGAERFGLIAAALAVTAVFATIFAGSFASHLSLVGLALVHASILVNVGCMIRERGISPERLRAMRDAWFVPMVVLLSTPMIDLSSSFGPLRDANIFLFEGLLGIRPEAAVHLLIAAVPSGHAAMEWIYGATAAVFAVPLLTRRARSNPLTLAMVGVGLFGYGCYMLCPAVGTFIAGYDRSLWPAAPIGPLNFDVPGVFAGVPRNCVPSIHAACAYLLIFNAWRFAPRLRRALVVFGMLTLLSAIEIGLHWAADLLVALPFTFATMALTETEPGLVFRIRAPIIAAGYGLTFAWALALRGDWLWRTHSSALAWSAVALTLAASVLLKWRLDYALGRRSALFKSAAPVTAATA
ncbi:MAG: phosphatase PAP2 family protein [Alphaproteobacteria bacterium]|nr:phosphatase PAP2 family protein [Alphaproteobacteria bacterium]